MSRASSRKGSRRERELVNQLDEDGWIVLRAPASGSAASRELPDLVAGNGAIVFAAEVKSGDPDSHRYVDEAKVDGLEAVAEGFAAHAVVFIRWDEDTTWYWNFVDEIPRTPSRNLSIKQWQSARWPTYDELVERMA